MRTTSFLTAIAAFSLIPSILASLNRRQNITAPAQNTTTPAIDPLVDPPFCALRCMGQTTTRFSCSPTDISCLCFMPEFPLFIGECLEKSCPKTDSVTAVSFSEAFCATIGVIIIVPIPGTNDTTTAPMAPQNGSVASAIDPAIATRVFFTATAASTSAASTSTTVSSSVRR